jgi:hypothetical protein
MKETTMTLRRASALVLVATSLLAGCDLADLIDNPHGAHTLVNVAVTHHASPEDGSFPDRGGEGEMRTFDTDEGWTVSLVAAFVTTQAVELGRCDGEPLVLDMYHGPIAEDITGRDLELLNVGGAQVRAAEFCDVQVTYGPYPTSASMQGLEPLVAGATFYLRGAATKGDVVVPFEIRSDRTLHATLDVSTIEDGAPLRVVGDEEFPIELALSKSYDRVLDGIDFASATNADLEAQVAASLELESRIGIDAVSPH